MATVLSFLGGCGEDGAKLSLDRFENIRGEEELVEVSLGDFSLPIPTAYSDRDKNIRYKTTLLLRFKLWALVTPREEAHALRLAKRNEGVLRDRVLTTCRKSPLSDLEDPNLTALRSRLLDELQPAFNGDLLRRVFMTDVLSDAL